MKNNEPINKLEKIYAVIVTFNPDFDNLSRLVSDLNIQGVSPIIVDNTPDPFIFKEDICAEIIRLGDNLGIAIAQNEGIKRAISLSAEYIIFFDQDSSISNNFIESITKDFIFIDNNLKANVAAIGPRFIDKRDRFYYQVISLNDKGIRKKIDVCNLSSPLEVSLIISSGSLVPVSVLNEVGFMAENYFIDYVDTEWCFRAISKGYSLYVSSSAIMEHTIGDRFIHLGRLKVPVHSAFRRYYRVRNAFLC